MRIAQVITGLDPAGAERIVSDLSRGLRQQGHELEVISLMPFPGDSRIVDELRADRIPVRSLGLRKKNPWAIFRLPAILEAFAPDIVHAHMYHANLAVRVGARRRRYRIVNTIHLIEPRASKQWLLLLDRLSRTSCDAYTAVSEGARRFHASKAGIPPDRISVIHNGIRPVAPLSVEEAGEFRRRWGVESCRVVLGAVGRLVPQKGFDLLLHRLSRAGSPSTFDGWGLVILGEGPERDALEKAAGRLPGGITVSFPGLEGNAARAMGAFDGLIVPSRYEGFGLVVAEAMAHGMPILASKIAPLTEVATGYADIEFIDFAAAGDTRMLEAIEGLGLKGGPRKPSFPYASDRMVKEYADLYTKLLRA